MGIERFGSTLHYAMLTQDEEPRLQATLWLTGSKIVGLSAARHARQGEVKEVCRMVVSFTSRAVVDYNGDGSVTIDVRRALDDKLQAGMRADVATSGRFESRRRCRTYRGLGIVLVT